MVNIYRDEKLPRIAFSDRLDTTNSADASKVVKDALKQINTNLILDVSKLNYISSAGLQVILLCAKDMSSKGRKVYLYGAKDDVLDIFEISGFLTFLVKIDSLDNA